MSQFKTTNKAHIALYDHKITCHCINFKLEKKKDASDQTKQKQEDNQTYLPPCQSRNMYESDCQVKLICDHVKVISLT